MAYHSRTLSKEEKNYSPWEIELCGVIDAVKKWRHFTDNGFQLTILSDHAGLSTLLKAKAPNPRQSRWISELQSQMPKIAYSPGESMMIRPSDHLSRSIFTESELFNSFSQSEYFLKKRILVLFSGTDSVGEKIKSIYPNWEVVH